MIKYFCDFNGCNNVVEDHRKIHISRMNPWKVYFKFHACESCYRNLAESMTNNLKDEEVT